MNCNCNNKNNSMKEAKIKHVFGNVLRIAIPLTLRTVELVDVDVDGEIEQQAQVTDTDFIPSSDYPVNVVFNKGAVKVSLKAQMRDGNIAYVEDIGKISVGTYDITVTCNDNDGNPYRFKQNTILQVVDATADAGIATPIEYEVTTWYLDAAIYLVMKGEDGVGIEDIITESSGEIGGINTVTFVLTNGETRSFTILNGSGSVDSDFDENSLHPLSNSVITNKFKSIDANIAGLFGDVDYDSSSKILRFWDITKSTILATIDARPFIKDGMVNRVYIQNRTLVITFNADSGHDTIAISLDSVFNPNNYYTRVQTDNRIADEISSASSGLMTKAEYVNEDSNNIKYSSAPEIVLSHIEGVSIMEESHSRLFGTSDGHIKGYAGATGSQLYDYGLAPDGLVFLDKTSGLFYRWDYITWQQVGNSSGGYEPPIGGIPKTDLAQSVQDTLDDVSNKVDKVAGKGLSTEDYTTAEKQKLSGLSNYDDTEIQAEVDAKYEKPNTGIPKTDLASGVQASLGKADTALQSSDLEGYATTDDVDDAVAALVSSAPQTLDTLNELAEALGDDPNFATTMATQLGNKVDKETGKGLSTNDYTTAEKNKLAGLENYDDSALQTAIDGKVDKESGKSLMTDAERTKLQGIAAGAEVNVQADWNQTTTTADDYIKNKPTIPTKTSDLTNDSGFIDKAMYYGESTTAAATMPKVCTVETFPTYTSNGVTHAKEGTIIAVKFTNSDTNTTDAPSLNVNGIGAKAIMYNNAIVTSTAKNTTVAGTAKMLAYYRYDPELNEGNGAWEFLAKSVDSNSTYSNASLGQGYGTQSNSAAATAITASISSYALSAGGIVTIKFTYDVPASATLNINSKGAKAIYNQGAAITAGVIKAGDTATFIYSTYYHLIAVDSWQDKQDAISDLATIRSGAAAGATAAQPADIPTKVSDLTNDSGFTSNAGTVTGISVNGGATQQPTNGVVSLTISAGGDNDIVGISDGTASDGAVVFSKRNGDTVTLDFNHSHPQYALANSLSTMAKLVVCKESELPSTLDNSTIYAITDSGETNLVKFIIRGMEFAGGGGSSSLPYDAEIEYLQTTGTQYIDTGIVSGTNIVAEIKAILTQTSSDVQTFLCARTGDNVSFSNLLSIKNVSTPYVQIGSGASNVDSSADPTVLHTYRTGLQNNSLFFETDGTTEGTCTISGSTSDLSLYLFARHTDSGVDRGIYSKLYYCKITKDGSLVRDFIPVRVGQTGYLYDRVSGELFRNNGTGSFTLGNDKS